MTISRATSVAVTWTWLLLPPANAAEPDYARHIAPFFQRYCSGCHANDEPEGKLSLDSHAALLRGGKNGAAIVPGKADESRLVRMLSGQLMPVMPPEDNERPKPEEIALVKAWIDAGAKGPSGAAPDPLVLVVPRIKPSAPPTRSIAALALAPDGSLLGVARFQEVELLRAADGSRLRVLAELPGGVNAVSFSHDGKLLVTACGEVGLFGEARLWNVADGTLVRKFRGHRDTLYAARLSPDGRVLATGSYDQKVMLWDAARGQPLRTITGHNGAVLDLDFSPDGKLLATASADRTVKLWNIDTGERLDTLGQPLKDQYAVAFSPDGQQIAAGGADRRIRVWAVTAGGREGTNPVVHTRFAHDGAILRLAWSRDGRTLVSAADNRTIKVWDAGPMSLRQVLPTQPDWTTGLALAPDGQVLHVGRMDGSFEKYMLQPPLEKQRAAPLTGEVPAASSSLRSAAALPPLAEAEPNDTPAQATAGVAPFLAKGSLHAIPGRSADVDMYRFESRAGQTWIVETNAARSGSPLDTKLEILHPDGKPVIRTLLQATRDSAVTFRGADDNAAGFRLTNWEEMELNEYLYVGGEVCKLHTFPRGPDSDFFFYQAGGRRRGYFDTTPTAHYLDEPCYIVRPYPPGTKLEPTGLPVFELPYANDDDSLRQLGCDSRLTFVAPADGAYLVRVSDVRGQSGEKHSYQLTVRPANPDFKVSIVEQNLTVNAGSAKRFTVRATRIDGYDGEIRVDVAHVPPGFVISTPLVIEAGHDSAAGMLYAAPGTPSPGKETSQRITVTATATLDGRSVTKPVNNFGELKVALRPKLLVHLELDPTTNADRAARPESAQGMTASTPTTKRPPEPVIVEQATFHPAQLTIAPGTMITAQLRVERHGFDGEVKFDIENLPHGVIVDDIGLSGILIPAGKSHRQVFLSARPWVKESSRLVYAVGQVEGNQASLPILLHVRASERLATQ